MGQKQYSDKNIVEHNFKNLTAEEQRKIASQGGKRSGEVRRQKKTLREIGDMLGGLDIKSEKNKQILRDAGVCDDDMIEDVAMMFQLKTKASKGDTKAIELLAKIRGQLAVEVKAEVQEFKPLIDLTERKNNIGSNNEKTEQN